MNLWDGTDSLNRSSDYEQKMKTKLTHQCVSCEDCRVLSLFTSNIVTYMTFGVAARRSG